MTRLTLLLICLGMWQSCANAAEPSKTCCHCGCCLRKVVRLECTTAEEVEHYYDCECEDFALLGPSKKRHFCVPSCDGCCQDGGCKHKVVWQPGHCGKPRTRKVLVKYELVRKVPAYQCVVEYVCDHCCCGVSCMEPVADQPPVPPTAARPQRFFSLRNIFAK